MADGTGRRRHRRVLGAARGGGRRRRRRPAAVGDALGAGRPGARRPRRPAGGDRARCSSATAPPATPHHRLDEDDRAVGDGRAREIRDGDRRDAGMIERRTVVIAALAAAASARSAGDVRRRGRRLVAPTSATSSPWRRSAPCSSLAVRRGRPRGRRAGVDPPDAAVAAGRLGRSARRHRRDDAAPRRRGRRDLRAPGAADAVRPRHPPPAPPPRRRADRRIPSGPASCSATSRSSS